MLKDAYNQLVSEVLALSYAEQLQLMALIVQQMQQERQKMQEILETMEMYMMQIIK